MTLLENDGVWPRGSYQYSTHLITEVKQCWARGLYFDGNHSKWIARQLLLEGVPSILWPRKASEKALGGMTHCRKSAKFRSFHKKKKRNFKQVVLEFLTEISVKIKKRFRFVCVVQKYDPGLSKNRIFFLLFEASPFYFRDCWPATQPSSPVSLGKPTSASAGSHTTGAAWMEGGRPHCRAAEFRLSDGRTR
jgi:hypothetical protein